MSLRDEAITHMAQAWFDSTREGDEFDSWDELKAAYQREADERGRSSLFDTAFGQEIASAAAALDALLDFLDAHTEEWRDSPEPARFHPSNQQIQALVAALRGPTEEE